MAAVQISNVHSKLIRSVAEREGITDYEITLNSGSIRGDNYLGVITNVVIKDRHSTKELNLVLKTSLQNEEARKQAPIRLAYIREIYVYEKIFKAYEDLQREKNIKNPFKAYAKCYATCSEDLNECLILQNMKAIGYKMWSRKEPMNAEHIAMVLAEYGKLHGVSMGLKHKKPEVFDSFKGNLSNVFMEMMPEEVMKTFLKTKFDKLVQDLQDDPKVHAIMKKYVEEKAMDFGMKAFTDVNEFSVFTHGDCWNNNMLFKYGDEKNPTKPTEMCLIDWQICSYGSPILDLAYYFFACSPKEIMYDYRTYLKIYYKSLSSTLAELDCDPETVMTYDQFEEQWNKYCKLGLHIAMTILKVMLSESEEAISIEEVAQSGQDIFSAFDYKSKNDDIYKQRMSDIVMFLHDHDLLMNC